MFQVSHRGLVTAQCRTMWSLTPCTPRADSRTAVSGVPRTDRHRYFRSCTCAALLQEMQFSFGRAIQRIPLTLMWGPAPQDHGSLNAVYEHTDAVLAPETNFTTRAAQAWLDGLCQNLEEWSQQPGSPVVAGTVTCPMQLIQEIAQLRSLPFPMPPEVRTHPPTHHALALGSRASDTMSCRGNLKV